ncbi:MAG: hypothetical protein JJU10_04135 [Idiomarina sp.]|nr:hypothetical protein [Idiomarina sp.]
MFALSHLVAIGLFVWPVDMERRQVLPATQALGLLVEAWQVYAPNKQVQRWIKEQAKDCIELPGVQDGLWQCVGSETIVSWDHSVHPSLWSIGRLLGGQASELDISTEFGPYRLHYQATRQPLFRIDHELRNEFATRPGVLVDRQRYQGALLYHWRRRDEEVVVTVWSRPEQSNLKIRLTIQGRGGL